MRNKILLLAVCLSVNFGIAAQQPRKVQPLTAAQIAEQRTEIMGKELGLTEKQQKKVYSINLRQAEKRQSQTAPQQHPGMRNGGLGGGMPPGGGMRGGMGSPGGGRGMVGGRGEMTHGGSSPGGSPHMGGERPDKPIPAAAHGGFFEEPEKEVAARGKKMKKILSPEQYSKWLNMENEHRRREMRDQLNRSIMPPKE